MSAEAGFRIDQTETDNQTSLEARFASNADQPLRYLAGLYYLHEGIDSNPGYDQEYNYSTEQVDATTNTVAGFGRLTWAFTDASGPPVASAIRGSAKRRTAAILR